MDDIRDKLRAEVMSSYWEDLAPHLSRGGLLLLAPTLDFLEVAVALAADDTQRVKGWLTSGALWRAGERDRAQYEVDDSEVESTQRFQFVVVQPWVLAQALVDLR